MNLFGVARQALKTYHIYGWKGHFGTLEIVAILYRGVDTVEPLYCGHFGTLEIVLSIEVSSIQRLNDALKYSGTSLLWTQIWTLETVLTVSGTSLLWTLWDLGNCP